MGNTSSYVIVKSAEVATCIAIGGAIAWWTLSYLLDSEEVPKGPAAHEMIERALQNFKVLQRTAIFDMRGAFNLTYRSGKVNGRSGITVFVGTNGKPNAKNELARLFMQLSSNNGRTVQWGGGDGFPFNTFGELKLAIKKALDAQKREAEDD